MSNPNCCRVIMHLVQVLCTAWTCCNIATTTTSMLHLIMEWWAWWCLVQMHKIGISGEEGVEENISKKRTLRQKPTFYPEITKILMFEKCEFCEKWDFEIVRSEIFKMWIFWKIEDFCPSVLYALSFQIHSMLYAY